MNPSEREQGRLLKYLDGKHLLVTGGTGSFGETLVSLCLSKSRVRRVVVYSRDEQKHVALHRKYKDKRLESVVGDVRDLDRLRMAMQGIHYVFNAAAMKHVHLAEQHPSEAVATNVLGAYHVCQAASESGVKTLVSLSTDKAVMPVNVMGMTKALQERLVASFAKGRMRVGVVRYGNVLASHGSVIPYFKQLLEAGALELPVTDRRMTRFVLTLRDSVNLVLYALGYCRDGETFVLDLPAFRIWDVAEVMAAYGSSRHKKIRVNEVGIRPGEKLHETLVSSEEMRRCVRKNGFWMVRRYRSAEELFPPGLRETGLSSDTVKLLSQKEIFALLKREGCLPVFSKRVR